MPRRKPAQRAAVCRLPLRGTAEGGTVIAIFTEKNEQDLQD
jgi:hypothetical protein